MDELKINENEHRSLSHKSSLSSRSSSKMNIELLKAKAKVEAAQTLYKASYAQKEIEIKVEQARLQATLDALRAEREKDVAVAEANALETGLNDLGFETRSEARGSAVTENQKLRTAQYVLEQVSNATDQKTNAIHAESIDDRPLTQCVVSRPGSQTNRLLNYDTSECGPDRSTSVNFKPLAPVVQTTLKTPMSTHGYVPSHPTHDLAKYLARSQLISTGLSCFDDQPMNYWAWKSSFKSAITGLDLSAGEELDLLVHYLGKNSAKQAKQMKAVNIRCPETGLKMTWERLEETYGSTEAVEQALFNKLEAFPKFSNQDPFKLCDLSYLLMELEAAKIDGYLPGLTYLDTSRGIQPIVDKLPYNIQEKWMNYGSKYKHDHGISFPPFTVFANFIHTEAKTRTDPSFSLHSSFQTAPERKYVAEKFPKVPISVHKIQVAPTHKQDADTIKSSISPNRQCPVHNKPHPLKRCRGFREKALDERKQILKKFNICYRCCSSTDHLAKNCTAEIACSECGSTFHISALHPGAAPWEPKASSPLAQHGGEHDKADTQEVASNCTEVCGEGISARECSKITLVNVFPQGHRERMQKMYAILDEQSNRSLARSQFFDMFQIHGERHPYTLKTCSGLRQVSGRRAFGFVVESNDEVLNLPLPTLLECNDIPNNRSEIPTPEAARHHAHLKRIADKIPPLKPTADILLLLGRDVLRVHKVREQINGPGNSPFAQRLDLGWVLVGDVCLDGVHKPPEVSTYKTFILENGRTSYFQPCNSKIKVKETFTNLPEYYQDRQNIRTSIHTSDHQIEHMGQEIFSRTANDHKLAPSIQDAQFLQIMDSEFRQDSDNSWVGPLPFKLPRQRLPNNKRLAHDRLMSLRRTLDKRPEMKGHFLEFMENMLKRGHAEVAPPLSPNQECWYLPLFGVYHPKKPDKIRVVFDSSAPFEGISLNDVLLTGPDLNNSLVGVLMRFRRERVAVTADIEPMFHCFVVQPNHRDYLRFLWYKDNDMSTGIIEYRMCVHIFGNSPSPSVAMYGLKRAAAAGEEAFGSDVRQFIEREFYVDDALKSFVTDQEAIRIFKGAQNALASSNLRLHKVTSNSPSVLEAFPTEDRAKDMVNLDLCAQDIPVQRSLGLLWNISTDSFTFQVDAKNKPFTRRGVLSTVNGIYDLQTIQIPRPYTFLSTSSAERKELFVFADASVKAISAVAYIKASSSSNAEVGFVFGKAKLAPQAGLTIPRLELCAAVLAVEVADLIVSEMDLTFDNIEYYTDSKVALGYIHNQSRRFYVFIHNRVQRILQSSRPGQWKYFSSELNPADHGSRSVPAAQLSSSKWFEGPAFLLNSSVQPSPEQHALVETALDVEIRPLVTANLTHVTKSPIKCWERFSSYSSLLKSITRLIHITRSYSCLCQTSCCRGWHLCRPSEEELDKAKVCIVKGVQTESYTEGLKCIKGNIKLSPSSSLWKLHPVLDGEGLLRVGGRIAQSDLGIDITNPLIIPARHHLGTLLIRHYHESVKHQGRHFTEGAIRSAGFWLVGAKRSISLVLHKCVTCRKLRGKTECQQMGSLPAERVQVAPLFTYVGADVFGPWEVMTRRTRGGQDNIWRTCSGRNGRKNTSTVFSLTKTFPSQDGLIRKVEVATVQAGNKRTFVRPISELVLLLSPE